MKYFRLAKKQNEELYVTNLNDEPLSEAYYRTPEMWDIHLWVQEYAVDKEGRLTKILEACDKGIIRFKGKKKERLDDRLAGDDFLPPVLG